MRNKQSRMDEIYAELEALQESPLYAYRKENNYVPVIGEGSLDAAIMFVGEAPGRKEGETGKPFCGASGKFLSELLMVIGLSRSDTYITSVVKDRPPENRDPTPAEIALYGPFLDRQIDIIRPRAIVALGRHSLGYLMRTYGLGGSLRPISEIHGQEFDARAPYGAISIVALYHPAAALYNGGMRATLKNDFEILRKYL